MKLEGGRIPCTVRLTQADHDFLRAMGWGPQRLVDWALHTKRGEQDPLKQKVEVDRQIEALRVESMRLDALARHQHKERQIGAVVRDAAAAAWVADPLGGRGGIPSEAGWAAADVVVKKAEEGGLFLGEPDSKDRRALQRSILAEYANLRYERRGL